MTCRKCKWCKVIKTLSGDKYYCQKLNKKGSHKNTCLSFVLKG